MSRKWFDTEMELMNTGIFADMGITPKKKEKKKEEKFMSFEEACKIVKACVDSEIEWIQVEENNPEEIKRIKKAWKILKENIEAEAKQWENL